FVVTDSANLYENRFSLGFYSCQVYGFIFAVCESMILLTLWVVCGWQYVGVVLGHGNVIKTRLSSIFVGIWMYSIFIGTVPLWPGGIVDPYEMRSSKLVCYWKVESTKPVMLVLFINGLVGIGATPFMLYYGYSKIASHIEAKLNEFSNLRNISKESARAQKMVALVVRRSKLTAIAFVLLFWATGFEMLYAMVYKVQPPQLLNMAVNFGLGLLCSATAWIFVMQDDTCRLFVINKYRALRNKAPLSISALLSESDHNTPDNQPNGGSSGLTAMPTFHFSESAMGHSSDSSGFNSPYANAYMDSKDYKTGAAQPKKLPYGHLSIPKQDNPASHLSPVLPSPITPLAPHFAFPHPADAQAGQTRVGDFNGNNIYGNSTALFADNSESFGPQPSTRR
ncbi:hypothetical protein BC831DRAFT_452506, partial [Entophlyctis helioformis]